MESESGSGGSGDRGREEIVHSVRTTFFAASGSHSAEPNKRLKRKVHAQETETPERASDSSRSKSLLLALWLWPT